MTNYTWLIDSTVTPPTYKALRDFVEVYNQPGYYKYDLHTWIKK